MLAIVLPESIFANSSSGFVREWIATKAEVRAVVSLPIETFSPFGANIKTSVLFCQKYRSAKRGSKDVFCGVLENIGYDASGRPVDGADYLPLAEALRESLR